MRKLEIILGRVQRKRHRRRVFMTCLNNVYSNFKSLWRKILREDPHFLIDFRKYLCFPNELR